MPRLDIILADLVDARPSKSVSRREYADDVHIIASDGELSFQYLLNNDFMIMVNQLPIFPIRGVVGKGQDSHIARNTTGSGKNIFETFV